MFVLDNYQLFGGEVDGSMAIMNPCYATRHLAQHPRRGRNFKKSKEEKKPMRDGRVIPQ